MRNLLEWERDPGFGYLHLLIETSKPTSVGFDNNFTIHWLIIILSSLSNVDMELWNIYMYLEGKSKFSLSFLLNCSNGSFRWKYMTRRIWISVFSLNDLNKVWKRKLFLLIEIYKYSCGFEMIRYKIIF